MQYLGMQGDAGHSSGERWYAQVMHKKRWKEQQLAQPCLGFFSFSTVVWQHSLLR